MALCYLVVAVLHVCHLLHEIEDSPFQLVPAVLDLPVIKHFNTDVSDVY